MVEHYKKLRGRLVECGYTIKRMAENIGITDVSLSAKLNKRSEFTAAEIKAICGIKASEIGGYFFS